MGRHCPRSATCQSRHNQRFCPQHPDRRHPVQPYWSSTGHTHTPGYCHAWCPITHWRSGHRVNAFDLCQWHNLSSTRRVTSCCSVPLVKHGAVGKTAAEPRNRVVQVRRFGSPDELEVVDAPMLDGARCGSTSSPQASSTPMLWSGVTSTRKPCSSGRRSLWAMER